MLLSLPATLGKDQLHIIAIGQVLPRQSPIPLWLDADPLTDYLLIPTDADSGGFTSRESNRYVRIYFPRNREALVEGFDFFVFPDGNLDPFTPSQLGDMRYAIENGLGSFVTTGGDLSSSSGSAYSGWVNSVLNEIMPVELNTRMQQDRSVFSIRVVKEEPPVLSMFVPLGIERARGAYAFTYLTTKIGATVWSRLRVVNLPQMGGTSLGIGSESDWLVSWRVGTTGGIFWVVADDLDSYWWSPIFWPGVFENDYADDLFINILLHSVGAPLPRDVSQLHDLRNLYSSYNVERSLMISLLDFADSFGAITRDVYLQMEEVDGLRIESFDKYREYSFAEASEIMELAMSRFAALREDAMDLKDGALLWIYLTQWVAVTGTSLTTGVVIWTLMVRKRLYREVGTTRLG